MAGQGLSTPSKLEALPLQVLPSSHWHSEEAQLLSIPPMHVMCCGCVCCPHWVRALLHICVLHYIELQSPFARREGGKEREGDEREREKRVSGFWVILASFLPQLKRLGLKCQSSDLGSWSQCTHHLPVLTDSYC